MKLIPVAGSLFALGLAGYEIKKKGLIAGVAHVGLDLIPIVGTTKNVIEIFAGDLIPDKQVSSPETDSPLAVPEGPVALSGQEIHAARRRSLTDERLTCPLARR